MRDVCRVVGLLDDDCRDSGVGRKERRPVHKINQFQFLESFTFFFLNSVSHFIFKCEKIMKMTRPPLYSETRTEKREFGIRVSNSEPLHFASHSPVQL